MDEVVQSICDNFITQRNVGPTVRAVGAVNYLNNINRHDLFLNFKAISDLEKPVDTYSITNVVLIKTSPIC